MMLHLLRTEERRPQGQLCTERMMIRLVPEPFSY